MKKILILVNSSQELTPTMYPQLFAFIKTNEGIPLGRTAFVIKSQESTKHLWNQVEETLITGDSLAIFELSGGFTGQVGDALPSLI